MTLILEILMISFGFFCLGYMKSRPKIWAMCLILISVIASSISTYSIKKMPLVLPSFPVEYTLLMKINELTSVLIVLLILYGIPFIVGYYIGKLVNNVENYQSSRAKVSDSSHIII